LPGVGVVLSALEAGMLFRHNPAPGTSAGDARGALAEWDAATATETDSATVTVIGHGHGH
jgi:hypothetical protein